MISTVQGGGGPSPEVQVHVSKHIGKDVEVVLTDLYPNIAAFKRAQQSNPHISFEEKPVDATKCKLTGIACSIFAQVDPRRVSDHVFEHAPYEPAASESHFA